MCSIPYEKFLPQNIFTSPSFLVALSSLNLLQISVHFIVSHTTKMLNDWHRWLHEALTKCDRKFTDYLKCRLNLTKYSLREPTWQSNRHNTKQAHMQGVYYFTMESVYWFQNVMKFIHETKTKYEDKISLKDDTKCIIYIHHMCHRATWSMKIMHIDS